MKPILLKSNKIEIPFQAANGNVVLTLWFDKGDEPLKKLEKEFEKRFLEKNDILDAIIEGNLIDIQNRYKNKSK